MGGSRVAVFGDVQGHADIYRLALTDLGVDVSAGVVPADLTVIQVGDLIHKGPASDEVVVLADRLLRHSPENYIQLIGNHEAQYLGGPVFWTPTISDASARAIAQWYVDGACRIAATVDSAEYGPLLISHGGLSVDGWVALDSTDDVVAITAALNEEFWNNPEQALRPGRMLVGEPGPPGVAWTEPTQELYTPWLTANDVPFGQVHGHASPYNWLHHSWYPHTPRRLRKAMVVDEVRRHTVTEVGSQHFMGIDTAFGRNDLGPIFPLMLTSR